jgi:hypothetical protein
MDYGKNEETNAEIIFVVLTTFEIHRGCHWKGVKSVTLEAPLLHIVSMDYGKNVRTNVEISFHVNYSGCVLSKAILLNTKDVISIRNVLYDSIKSLQVTKCFVNKLLNINAAKLCLHIDQMVFFFLIKD